MTSEPSGLEEPTRPTRLPWGRLFAEFAVIVIGVLVALAFDAAWEAREERAREVAYLEQILVDLEASEADVAYALDVEARVIDASTALLGALRAPTLPAPDSLSNLLVRSTSSYRLAPIMGTIEGLVETGDIRIVRSGDVRSAILEYRTAVESGREHYTSMVTTALSIGERLGQSIDMSAVMLPSANAEGVDWAELRRSVGVRSDLAFLRLAAQNRVYALTGVEEERAKLEAAIRTELERP